MNTCRNCNSELQGNYCSNCGQPVKLKRIDRKYMKEELGQVLQFEKGIFFTVKELLIRPGKSIRIFIAEDRNRLVKPILFIILTSLVYTLVEHYFRIEEFYLGYKGPDDSAISIIFAWIQRNYGYFNIILGVFITFWVKILFKKYAYNFYEILILLYFAIGITMLIFSLFIIIEVFTKLSVMQYTSLASTIYLSWAIGSFFEKKFKNYLKAFAAYILGTITFAITAIILGLLADLIF